MGHMEDVSSCAPPGFRPLGPPAEVRERRATWGFFEREEGGEKRKAVRHIFTSRLTQKVEFLAKSVLWARSFLAVLGEHASF